VKPSSKYAMIQKYAKKFTVKELCEYFKVSRSGYYSWIKTSPNRRQREQRDQALAAIIQECQKKSDKTYGYRRVRAWILKSYGVCMNHKTVLRLMNKYGLLAEIRRPRPLYMRQQQMRRYENVLNRNFLASYPNQKWATDISYIFTDDGTLYLSMIKDLHDSFIVAFDMATTQDNALVYRTLKKAKKEIADGLVLHSDQGFQYTSTGYFNLTQQYGITPSMSRPGTPYDNACAENFCGILKTECIYRHHPKTINEAKKLIADYIHFYNYERIQTENMLTPYQMRRQHE
jgi:putative transposase